MLEYSYGSNYILYATKRKSKFIILILYLLVNQISSKTIVYRNFFGSNDGTWNSYFLGDCSNLYDEQNCTQFKILRIIECGNLSYHNLIYRTFELQPHYQLNIEFKFLKRNLTNDSVFNVYIDHVIVHNQTYFNIDDPQQTCRIANYFNYFPISVSHYHSSSTVTIGMIGEKGFWGITEFELSIKECEIGCDSCNSSGCLNQILLMKSFNKQFFSSLNLQEEWQANDGTIYSNIEECYGFNFIRISQNELIKEFELDQHIAISFQLELISFNSLNTSIQIQIDNNQVATVFNDPLQLDFEGNVCKFTSIYKINLFQQTHYKKNLKITIKVDLQQRVSTLDTYFGIRDFKLFRIVYDDGCIDNNIVPFDGCFSKIYDCVKGCENCIRGGICLNCLDGWIYQELTKICYPDCGDSIVTDYEECDDGNLIENDGCHQCKYSCPNNCMECQFGQCLKCQNEYLLFEGRCVLYCDDIDQVDSDQKQQCMKIQDCNGQLCQNSCQIECLTCYENKCFICQDGWQLQDYQCKQICGDGIVAIISNEQCDDLENMYCVNCQFQCDNNCLVCDKFENCEICLLPFEMKDGKCLPVCGDNIATLPFESCDDGNDIPFDGCYQCQLQCSFGCLICEKDNHCVQCDNSNYFLDSQTFQCKKIQLEFDDENNNDNDDIVTDENIKFCGDGMLNSSNEQCDDGNNNGGDGCSSICFEEDSYVCINQENQLSLCTFIQNPNFNMYLLSDKQNQTKLLELSFSEEVYLSTEFDFEQIIRFDIIPQTLYILQVNPLSNITTELCNPNYLISISFLEPVSQPMLQINIQQQTIFNSFNLSLKSNFKEISLGTPFVLSQTMQQRVTQIIKVNDIILYSTIGIAGLLLLTGNTIVFFNLLDLLQSLSYIKYMQYKFPPHLKEFLETYTKISLQPIMEILKVDQIIAQLNGGTLPYSNKKSQQSVQINALNQFYLINLKGCYISYLVSLATYFLCCLVSSNKTSLWLERMLQKYNNLKFQILFIKFKKQILMKSQNVKNLYFSLGLFQLLYSTLHQLLFSTLLQFPQYSFDSPFEIFNSIAALISLLFIIFVTMTLLSITTSSIKDKKKWRYFFQDSKANYWAFNFKPFQFYRTIFYITIIVQLHRYPEAQSVLLSMQSLFYLIYLILFKPSNSNFDLIKLMCRESILFLITGSFLIYSFSLNFDQFLLFGWLHIGLFCFLMGFTLIVDILEQGIKAYKLHKKNQQAKVRIQQKYSENEHIEFAGMYQINLKDNK